MSTPMFDYATFPPLSDEAKGWWMGAFGPLANARVLVVEDEAVATHLSSILVNAGFGCETSSSIQGAVAAIDARSVDVILCAVHTNVVNGVDFLHLIRSRRPDIPLILLAEDPSVPAAVAAMRQGAFDGSVLI